jgi:hypothetical protein
MPASSGLSATRAAAFIFSVLALVGTWIFLFTFYRDYRKDRLRLKLRRIRDQVWDMAVEQRWPLLTGDVKSTIDYAGAAVRAASCMTLTRCLLFQGAGVFPPELRRQLPAGLPSELVKFREEIDCAIASHIVGFPLFLILRKIRRTWPPAGAIQTLIRTAEFSSVLIHEPRH